MFTSAWDQVVGSPTADPDIADDSDSVAGFYKLRASDPPVVSGIDASLIGFRWRCCRVWDSPLIDWSEKTERTSSGSKRRVLLLEMGSGPDPLEARPTDGPISCYRPNTTGHGIAILAPMRQRSRPPHRTSLYQIDNLNKNVHHREMGLTLPYSSMTVRVLIGTRFQLFPELPCNSVVIWSRLYYPFHCN